MNEIGKDAATNRSTQGEQLAKALRWIVNDRMLSDVSLHGNVKWVVEHLVRVAILWVWSSKRFLVDSADDAIQKTCELFGSDGIKSYQTLTAALKTYTAQILPPLLARMRQLMEQTEASKFRIGLWLVLAVDGSRLGTPRTRANEQRFSKLNSKEKNAKKKKRKRGGQAKKRTPVSAKKNGTRQPVGPQIWLTLLWHVGLRMPWAFKIGPSYSSERSHLLELVGSLQLPQNTLICGDAGFVGYDFWNAIDQAGHRFLCRVGSNCSFLKRLGHVRERDGIVYCWPEKMQRRKLPPLVLRLIRLHDGRGDVYLVTNELNVRRLSDASASHIYRQRWGIEVQFRSLKQTYDRSKLLGRTPDIAEQELTWSLVGLWMAQLLALREQTDLMEADAHTSVAMLMRVIQDILQRPDLVPARGESLGCRLAGAVTDTYDRKSKKKSRNYPRRKEEPHAGPPKVKLATTQQKKLHQLIPTLANAA